MFLLKLRSRLVRCPSARFANPAPRYGRKRFGRPLLVEPLEDRCLLTGWVATTPQPDGGYVEGGLVGSSGHIYQLGGVSNDFGYPDGIKVYYAPVQGSGQIGAWTAGAPLPDEPVLFHAAVTWSQTLYVLGGYHFSGGFQPSPITYYSVLNLDGSPGPWTHATPLPMPVWGQGAAVWNGWVYVTGGTNDVNVFNTVYAAPVQGDGSLGPWTPFTALPTAIYVDACVALNGYLYVLGGVLNDGSTLSNQVYVASINADGSLGSWQTTTALPQAVGGHTATAINGQIYVVGGLIGTSLTNAVWISTPNPDGSLGSWQAGPSIPDSRYTHGATVSDDGTTLFVAGGANDSTGIQSDVWSLSVGPGPSPPTSPQSSGASAGTPTPAATQWLPATAGHRGGMSRALGHSHLGPAAVPSPALLAVPAPFLAPAPASLPPAVEEWPSLGQVPATLVAELPAQSTLVTLSAAAIENAEHFAGQRGSEEPYDPPGLWILPDEPATLENA
jgi:hypothetical protein